MRKKNCWEMIVSALEADVNGHLRIPLFGHEKSPREKATGLRTRALRQLLPHSMHLGRNTCHLPFV